MSNITIKEAASLLAASQNILLTCHTRPDGDTLGSAFALKLAMEAKEHEVNVICAEKVPDRIAFISGGETELFIDRLDSFNPNIVCSVDAAETELMGEYGKRDFDLKLDHHGSGYPYAKNNYIDGSRAACAEIIYDVIRELEAIGHATLTPEAATALYAAITSDTGCFKYSNVTSSTMRISADLIDAGANYEKVCKLLFETRSINETSAQRIALNHLNFYRSGTIAAVTFTTEMKAEGKISDDDIGAIGSYLREIDGVQISIVLKQSDIDKNNFRTSMRTGPEIDACKMCKLFGGGGHARAAGCTVTAETPEIAEKTVIDSIIFAIDKNN